MASEVLKHGYAELDEVFMHYVEVGNGPHLLLVHGWPQTWYEWRHVIPALSRHYHVIAPDLRGMGDSSRPVTGYDKRTLAGDLWQLMHDHFKVEEFHLVGHDWGGPTAFALAAAHPGAVLRLAILDVVIPGDGAEGFSQGGRRWHHAFHMTADLPEALIQGREKIYLSWFYRNFAHRPDAVGPADLAEYLRTYEQPGAMRAGLELYRTLPQDIADNRDRIAQGKLPMPVLGIGGAKAFGRGAEVGESLRRVADQVEAEIVPDCGHFIPEEAPDFLAKRLLRFFGGA
ncbi:Pimeloyl-ACP methyl ester carboxylesterase [Roseovarius azorensis]|uniref:Pimeloyl-ACP methyl ester carboxylesterase n=1 Tax=Roseovarius azorensis TaxID=1287727 RepID=A0A1H7QGU4_9RHOB|nr:alpha/beta fold hydrolase [Roseovarius azorensis]SEL47156.1 Pimeloyl-ACP methyl ester carboxylesterase [Roseovarius azorensis]